MADQDRIDAERYRWLRQHAHARTYRDVRCFVEVPRGPCEPELLEVRGMKLDQAIDAARGVKGPDHD